MKHEVILPQSTKDDCEQALQTLEAAKHRWARLPVSERLHLLARTKDALMEQAEGWALAAARHKRIPGSSSLVGEEWLSGPYAVMSACNGLMLTLSQMEKKQFLAHLPTRRLATGQLAVQVMPHGLWDHLLLSGVRAEVWMQRGVNEATLAAASIYDVPADARQGKVALVLGAGNIAAISPLDAFHKLFNENEVVLLKLNPVNDYLFEYLNAALKPLIDANALRIVKGDGGVGAWLTEHPLVESIHITGAGATHDAIAWGTGEEGVKNRKSGWPKNPRSVTSELGAVCPTIVVPGPWSKRDIAFQAEQIATQKLHNSGYNCIAMQTLVLPEVWRRTDDLMHAIERVMARAGQRSGYYPGSAQRLDAFAARGGTKAIARGSAYPACLVANLNEVDAAWFNDTEVFAPAMATKRILASDPEQYLRQAIAYANTQLYGTLGANIVIHPRTIKEMGRARFEEILSTLHYGTIAVNTWTGLGFLLAACPWGGYPGATLQNPGSGIGTVHNTFMLEQTERTVVEAPWRPFPRNLASLDFGLLPRPPWFITHRRQHVLGPLLTRFQHKPSVAKLPRIFLNALRG